MKPKLKYYGWSLLTAAMLVAVPAPAQQITGTPGAPSATVTIDGKQLPPPPMKFGGVIKESALESKPFWPSRVVPPKGAPNILLITSASSAFDIGPIPSGPMGSSPSPRRKPRTTCRSTSAPCSSTSARAHRTA